MLRAVKKTFARVTNMIDHYWLFIVKSAGERYAFDGAGRRVTIWDTRKSLFRMTEQK